MKYIRLETQFSQFTLDKQKFESIEQQVHSLELPAFQQHSVDFIELKKTLEPYQKYTNIIIIANGGSRTSALAYWQALAHKRNSKTVEFLSTMEPGVIAALKATYTPKDTLVMPISKSGTNVDVIEPLLHFLEYTVLPVTSPEKGVLYEIAKRYKWDIIPHPEVGGRYSGRTECGFAPALLMGLDAEAIDQAARTAYETVDYRAPLEQNSAFHAAALCAELDTKGYTEIFMPVYSQPFAGFLPLIVQLIHESTGKDGKGQTIFGDQAPESQHHTNQRFFGGRTNALGWFITAKDANAENQQLTTTVPTNIADIPFNDGHMSDLDGIPLADAVRFDYEGVAENATRLGIPHFTVEIDGINEQSVGEFLAFIHYYTVYSAILRNQDPFDQPEVEAAKEMSFNKRRAFHSV